MTACVDERVVRTPEGFLAGSGVGSDGGYPVVLVPSSESEWLEARLSGISGSDVAAILGLSPFRSPLDVFCEKLRLVEGPAESLPMRVGKALEPFLVAEYNRQTGLEARPSTALYRSSRYPWMLGTPDAFVASPSLGVEFKTASVRSERFWGDGEDAIPDYYLTQIAWYAAITGIDTWNCAVLIGNSDFRIYTIRRDPGLEQLLIEKAQEFWEKHVLTQEPPALDGSSSCDAYLRARFPRSSASLRSSNPVEDALAAELARVRSELGELERQNAALEARMKLAIGEAQGIQGEGWRATWKRAKDSSVTDWESVVKHLPQDDHIKNLVRGATRSKAGTRRFLFKTEGDSE